MSSVSIFSFHNYLGLEVKQNIFGDVHFCFCFVLFCFVLFFFVTQSAI